VNASALADCDDPIEQEHADLDDSPAHRGSFAPLVSLNYFQGASVRAKAWS
jgi:hypothetical protein